MATYVPGTGENNVSRINQSLQQIGPTLDTATANIATNTTNIATNTAAIAALQTGTVTTIAGNSGAFTLNSASGITNATNDIKLQQASSSQFGAVKVDGTTIAATAGVIKTSLPTVTSSLGADVLLNNTGNFFDGPSIAQGTSGTWLVTGTVTLLDTAVATYIVKLWDGTTVIASTVMAAGAGFTISIALSGVITSPAANIRISVRDASTVNGKILFNSSGVSKDSTLTGIRIG